MLAFLQGSGGVAVILGVVAVGAILYAIKVKRDAAKQTAGDTGTGTSGTAATPVKSVFEQNVAIAFDNLQELVATIIKRLESLPNHVRVTILLGFLVAIRSQVSKLPVKSDRDMGQAASNALSQLLVSTPDPQLTFVQNNANPNPVEPEPILPVENASGAGK